MVFFFMFNEFSSEREELKTIPSSFHILVEYSGVHSTHWPMKNGTLHPPLPSKQCGLLYSKKYILAILSLMLVKMFLQGGLRRHKNKSPKLASLYLTSQLMIDGCKAQNSFIFRFSSPKTCLHIDFAFSRCIIPILYWQTYYVSGS